MLFPTSYIVKPPVGTQPILGHPLTPNVGAWLFNEGSGNKVFDLINRNHGVLNNSPIWEADSIDFTANNQYISFSPLSFSSTEKWSIVTCVKPDSVGTEGIFGNLAASSTRAFWQGEKFNLYGDTGSVNWAWVPTANVLSHITLTYDGGGNSELFIDGISKGIKTNSNTHTISAFPNIGTGYAYCLDGLMQYFFVYSAQLESSQISRLYADPYCWLAQPMEAELMYAPPPVGVMSPYYYETLMAGAVI